MTEIEFSNEVSLRRFLLIAEKIRRDPSLLQIPLENIAHWRCKGHWGANHLDRWQVMIESALRSPEGMQSLLDLLCNDSEPARFQKSFSPFAGILTREERRTCRGTWTYAH